MDDVAGDALITREKVLRQRHVYISTFLMPYYVPSYNPNMYEGFYMQNVSYVFNDSDVAVLNETDITMNNSGFETDSNSDNVPDYWAAYNSPSSNWTRDCTVSHSGSCSEKLTYINSSNPPYSVSNNLNYPITGRISLKPNRIYELSFFARKNSSNPNPREMAVDLNIVLYNSSGFFSVQSITSYGNNDSWKKYSDSFSTTNNGVDSFYIYSRLGDFSSSALNPFELWIDDINLTEVGNKLLNVAETNDTTFHIWDENKTINYILGLDYNISSTGTINPYDPYNGKKSIITRINNGKIPVNSKILVDYDFIGSVVQATPSFSDPGFFDVYNISILYPTLSKITPDFILIGMDEIYGLNRDSRALKKGLKNYQTLGYFIDNITKVVHTYNSTIQVLMWDDMINPLHNGGNINYQTNFGGQVGKSWYALDLIDKSVGIISWDYGIDTGKIGTGINGKIRISPNLFNTYGYQSFAGPSTYGSQASSIQWSYEAYKYNIEGMISPSFYNNISTIFYPANYSWNAIKDKSLSQLNLCEDGSTDFNLSSDPFDCGSCGNICYSPHSYFSCISGTCHFDGCMEGFVLNNGNCVINNNCGNGICESGESCSNCATDCGNCPYADNGNTGPSSNPTHSSNSNLSNGTQFNINLTFSHNNSEPKNDNNETTILEVPKEVMNYLAFSLMIVCIILFVIMIVLIIIRTFKNRESKNKFEENEENIERQKQIMMIKAKNLIVEAREKGYSEEHIRQIFSDKGWSEDSIDSFMS